MNLELLQTFLSLEDTRSFRKTAERLYISQSAVTMRVKKLENELGQNLFIRNNKGIMLTEAGATYLPFAQQMYQMMLDSDLAMKSLNSYSKRIYFAATTSVWRNRQFTDRVIAFIKNNPSTYLKLNRDYSDNIIKDLAQGLLDIGITHYMPHNSDISCVPFITEPLVLVAAPEIASAFAVAASGDVPDREDIPLIHMDYGPSVKDELTRALPSLSSRISTNSQLVLASMIKDGLGVGLSLRYEVEDEIERGELDIIDCDYNKSPTIYRSYIIFSKKKERRLRAFLDSLIGGTPSCD